jgi:hypothetical protein
MDDCLEPLISIRSASTIQQETCIKEEKNRVMGEEEIRLPNVLCQVKML